MSKKWVAGLALLVVVSSAGATVELFFTGSNGPYGLDDPYIAFDPTNPMPVHTDYHFYHLTAAGAPAFEPNALFDPAGGEWLYIWLRFNGEPNNVTIQGLNLAVGPADKVVQTAYYVMDNEGADGANAKRWDGDVNTDQFTANPVILAAVTARGIKNTNAGAMDHDPLWVGPTVRTALLGAVKMAPDTIEATLSLGPLGIQYAGGVIPQVTFGSATPEPATSVMLTALMLLGRRRR